MKIIFFGLGSIGRRHIDILQKHYDHELFAFRSGFGRGKSVDGVTDIFDWDGVDKVKPDVAFICNPTNQHISTAIPCALRGMALFIEKPIDCSLAYLRCLLGTVDEKEVVSYVAYPFRHHPVISAIKAENFTPKDVDIYCHSCFPSWRKYETYSHFRRTGGGAILELSHEIDYAEYLFGEVESITGRMGRIHGVTYDAEDYAILDLQHKSGLVSHVTLDIDCPFSRRDITIDGIGFDLLNQDGMYERQMQYFFDNIENRRMENNLFDASRLFRKIIEFRGE